MVAGLAVAKVIEEVGGADRSRVTLKWPNDVLVDLDTDQGGKVVRTGPNRAKALGTEMPVYLT